MVRMSTDNGCYGKDINSNLVEYLLKLCTQLESEIINFELEC